MKAAINTLGHVLYSPSQYVIPVFQRNYRWERPQWEKLWASLVEIQQPDKTGNHFMGFLVFVQGGVAQPGQNTRFHLIDGQQRLTTNSLLLSAIRNVARRHGQNELAEEVHQYYLVHPLKKGEHHFRLLPKAQDHDAFIAIILGKAAPAGRMADALGYFETQLDALAVSDGEALRRMFDLVCQRLEFMCATLESENAYSIFKSLNSTGVPLGQADLIRNFVFMHVHPDQQDDFDSDHWAPLEALFSDPDGRLDEARFSRFFRDVLMAESGQYVQPADTFATFEARNEATGFSPRELVKRLMRHAQHYAVINGSEDSESVAVTLGLRELNRLESSTTYPLLLALFDAVDHGRMLQSGLVRSIGMLRGFIFRRFIAGESSRGYGQMFVRAIDRNADDPMFALEKYMLARGWPHDDRFVEAFIRFPLYKRGYAREVLETLEDARGHKEAANLGQAQVEHVMPQTLSDDWVEDLGDEPERVHAEWLHSPGNLTLSAYNQEVGNQPFAKKRRRFVDSNVGLTREVGESTQWTELEIQERGERMAREAASLWYGPAEPHASEDVAVQVQESREVRLAFWRGFAAYLSHAHPDLQAIQPIPKRTIRLKSGLLHVTVESRFKVQEDAVTLDIYLHRKLLRLWESIHADQAAVDAMIGETWTIDRAPKGEYGWLTVSRVAPSSDPAHWPALHAWLGQKMEQVFGQLLPYLLEEIQERIPAVLASATTEDELSSEPAIKQLQQRFWAELSRAVAQRDTALRPQKPLPQHWTNYAIGRAGFSLTPFANSRDDRIGVDLIIGTTTAKEQFQALFEQRSSIEAALGFSLDWQEMPHRIQSKIGCVLENSPPEDETRWPEYVEWLSGRLVRMDEIFRPLVRGLP